MDQEKTGRLICQLRREQGMTQQQLADLLMLSPKTISKWETGAGSPDVSLLAPLAAVLGVSGEQLLQGQLEINETDGGNMKHLKFYRCAVCGNVLTGTGNGEVICCGRKLQPLAEQDMTGEHQVQLEEMDGEAYLTLAHPMEKGHFITFVAWSSYDRSMLVRLYPEQNAELRMPLPRRGTLYVCCSQHGLFRRNIK